MENGRVAARLQTARILWFSLVMTNAIYVAVIASHAMHGEEQPPPHMPELLGGALERATGAKLTP